MPRSRAATSGPTGALAVRTSDVALTKSGISFRPSDDLWDWLDGPFHLRLNFIPKTGTATLTTFTVPDVISTQRVYLYP